MRTRLFTIVPMVVLFFAGACFAARPRPTFVRLNELVDNIGTASEVCEGQLEAVREGEEINWIVDCKEARLRIVRTSSIVGQPQSGYAAYAELPSPRRFLSYSLWVYPESSEATKARSRWKEKSTHEVAEYEVDERPNGFLMTRKDKYGMPSWVWVAQEGNRLAVVIVKASAPRLTPEQVEQGIAQEMNKHRTREEAARAFFEAYLENLHPEDEQATKAFFEKVSCVIEERFLKAKKRSDQCMR